MRYCTFSFCTKSLKSVIYIPSHIPIQTKYSVVTSVWWLLQDRLAVEYKLYRQDWCPFKQLLDSIDLKLHFNQYDGCSSWSLLYTIMLGIQEVFDIREIELKCNRMKILSRELFNSFPQHLLSKLFSSAHIQFAHMVCNSLIPGAFKLQGGGGVFVLSPQSTTVPSIVLWRLIQSTNIDLVSMLGPWFQLLGYCVEQCRQSLSCGVQRQ